VEECKPLSAGTATSASARRSGASTGAAAASATPSAVSAPTAAAAARGRPPPPSRRRRSRCSTVTGWGPRTRRRGAAVARWPFTNGLSRRKTSPGESHRRSQNRRRRPPRRPTRTTTRWRSAERSICPWASSDPWTPPRWRRCATCGWRRHWVGRCRLIVSQPDLKACLVSALETKL